MFIIGLSYLPHDGEIPYKGHENSEGEKCNVEDLYPDLKNVINYLKYVNSICKSL